MFDELSRQLKRSRGRRRLLRESRRNRSDKTGQVRVGPQVVQLTEEFRYTHSSGHWQPDPEFGAGRGTISAVTSIDDQESLVTAGRLDLRSLHMLDPRWSQPNGSFLSFHNHGMTDLERLIAQEGGFDSLALRAPAGAGRPEGQAAELGLQKSHQRASYRVDQPTRLPIEATLTLAEGEPPDIRLGHNLYLLFDLRLYLPDMGHRPQPHLDHITIDWPWLAESAEAVDMWLITREDYENPRGFADIEIGSAHLDTTYDTAARAIVGRPAARPDGALVAGQRTRGKELAFYYSLLIQPKRPLQLIEDETLTARVGVTFDSLLSGTEVRLHHATGYLDESTPIETTTLVEAVVDVKLGSAMPQRLAEQRNSLRFPGVQPSTTVIDTIRATVLSCGYRLTDDDLRPPSEDGTRFGGRIQATRLVGGNAVEIIVAVAGRFRRVDRTLRGAGGPRLKEEILAGDVEVRLYGSSEGNHDLLTAEVNSLHANLRSRLSTFVEA